MSSSPSGCKQPAGYFTLRARAISIADDHAASHLRHESKILRLTAKNRAMTDGVVFSHHHAAADDGVRLNHRAVADDHIFLDNSKRTNADTLAKPGLRMNDGGRIGIHPFTPG